MITVDSEPKRRWSWDAGEVEIAEDESIRGLSMSGIRFGGVAMNEAANPSVERKNGPTEGNGHWQTNASVRKTSCSRAKAKAEQKAPSDEFIGVVLSQAFITRALQPQWMFFFLFFKENNPRK